MDATPLQCMYRTCSLTPICLTKTHLPSLPEFRLLCLRMSNFSSVKDLMFTAHVVSAQETSESDKEEKEISGARTDKSISPIYLPIYTWLILVSFICNSNWVSSIYSPHINSTNSQTNSMVCRILLKWLLTLAPLSSHASTANGQAQPLANGQAEPLNNHLHH